MMHIVYRSWRVPKWITRSVSWVALTALGETLGMNALLFLASMMYACGFDIEQEDA